MTGFLEKYRKRLVGTVLGGFLHVSHDAIDWEPAIRITLDLAGLNVKGASGTIINAQIGVANDLPDFGRTAVNELGPKLDRDGRERIMERQNPSAGTVPRL